MARPITTHLFVLDATEHAGHRGETPCPWCPCQACPLPAGNRVHDLPDAPDAQAEHRRRIGDEDDR
ncbi:hypothetical protein ACGFIG_09435 [Micromonospora sp. NPDC049048]|uniref:hypothetical protein n=1 Tax=Micromonospora sp. NPDC049048 TaxID=3364263 RepID=UPI003715D0DA